MSFLFRVLLLDTYLVRMLSVHGDSMMFGSILNEEFSSRYSLNICSSLCYQKTFTNKIAVFSLLFWNNILKRFNKQLNLTNKPKALFHNFIGFTALLNCFKVFKGKTSRHLIWGNIFSFLPFFLDSVYWARSTLYYSSKFTITLSSSHCLADAWEAFGMVF